MGVAWARGDATDTATPYPAPTSMDALEISGGRLLFGQDGDVLAGRFSRVFRDDQTFWRSTEHRQQGAWFLGIGLSHRPVDLDDEILGGRVTLMMLAHGAYLPTSGTLLT